MKISDRQRIVQEYCKSLKAKLNKIVTNSKFPEDWNGIHIRYIAMMFTETEMDNTAIAAIKKAKKDIDKNFDLGI